MTIVKHDILTGWDYIILEEYNTIVDKLSRYNIIFYLILFFVLISANTIYAFLIKKISLSVETLAKKMRQSANEYVEEDVKRNTVNDEFLVMYEDLDRLVGRIKKMIQEDYTKQLTIRETEHKMLQMQITPHFLYNTLQSISMMAKMGRSGRIPDVVSNLSNLLRASIDTEYVLHTIGEEIEILRDYIDIQLERFGDRLSFSIEESVYEAEGYLIPKMTLQPIVENCICHILEKVPGQCIIEVKAIVENNDAKIMILDNGYGISESRVKSILEGTYKSKHNSIGLYNVNKRLEYYFGEDYGLNIYTRPEGGVCVEVRITKTYQTEVKYEEGLDC